MTEEELKRFKSMNDHDLLIEVATDVRHIKESINALRTESVSRLKLCRAEYATKTQLNSVSAAVKWLYSIVATLFTGLVLWIAKT